MVGSMHGTTVKIMYAKDSLYPGTEIDRQLPLIYGNWESRGFIQDDAHRFNLCIRTILISRPKERFCVSLSKAEAQHMTGQPAFIERSEKGPCVIIPAKRGPCAFFTSPFPDWGIDPITLTPFCDGLQRALVMYGPAIGFFFFFGSG